MLSALNGHIASHCGIRNFPVINHRKISSREHRPHLNRPSATNHTTVRPGIYNAPLNVFFSLTMSDSDSSSSDEECGIERHYAGIRSASSNILRSYEDGDMDGDMASLIDDLNATWAHFVKRGVSVEDGRDRRIPWYTDNYQ